MRTAGALRASDIEVFRKRQGQSASLQSLFIRSPQPEANIWDPSVPVKKGHVTQHWGTGWGPPCFPAPSPRTSACFLPLFQLLDLNGAVHQPWGKDGWPGRALRGAGAQHCSLLWVGLGLSLAWCQRTLFSPSYSLVGLTLSPIQCCCLSLTFVASLGLLFNLMWPTVAF